MNIKFIVLIFGIAASLLSSLIPIPETDVWYSQYVSVLFFVCIFFVLEIIEFRKSLGIFLAYITFSTFFVANQDLMSLMCLMPTMLCFWLIKEISELSVEKRKNIFKTILALLCIQIFWGVLQKFNLDPFFRNIKYSNLCDTVGFSGSHNQYGLFLAAASSSALYFGLYWLIPLIFIAIVLSQTFTAYLGFAISALFFFIFRWNNRPRFRFCWQTLSILPLIFCLFFVLLVPKSFSAKYEERVGLWKLSVSQVNAGKALMVNDKTKETMVKKCNPWFGFGFGQFMKISPYTQKAIIKHGVHRYEHAHNDYIEVLFDLGRVGVVLLIALFVDMVLLFKKAKKTPLLVASAAAILAYAVCALAIYTVHTATGGVFLAIYLGLFLAEALNTENLNGT